jgi:hypothetical protein
MIALVEERRARIGIALLCDALWLARATRARGEPEGTGIVAPDRPLIGNLRVEDDERGPQTRRHWSVPWTVLGDRVRLPSG